MRVISQSGMVDVPYENFVFSCTGDNYIVCTIDTVAPPSEIARAEMAKYSCRQHALKAMEMLRNTYYNFLFQKTYKTDTNEFSAYFQFPSDEDLEV